MLAGKLRAQVLAGRELLRTRPWTPSVAAIVLDDLARASYRRDRSTHKFSQPEPGSGSTSEHLDAALTWLARAQDATPDGGVATAYELGKGWMPSYPETTGYIIPTAFDYAAIRAQPAWRERALRMAEWLLSVQLDDGAFPGGPVGSDPVPSVFNSGQILFGLVRAASETGDERYLQAAERAGRWLVEAQDGDGAWRRYAYNAIPHVYYTRVASALLELAQAVDGQRYREGAIRHLAWAMSNRQPNGWFANNAFVEGADPFTHNIVYAAEGLLGSGELLGDDELIAAAEGIASKLQRHFEVRKFLPGTFDAEWRPSASYCCVTGAAQLSGLLVRLYEIGGNAGYLNTALKLNEYLKWTQPLSRNRDLRGGVKGSDPVWGAYLRYSLPNWAAKFFADALMMELRVLERLGPLAR